MGVSIMKPDKQVVMICITIVILMALFFVLGFAYSEAKNNIECSQSIQERMEDAGMCFTMCDNLAVTKIDYSDFINLTGVNNYE